MSILVLHWSVSWPPDGRRRDEPSPSLTPLAPTLGAQEASQTLPTVQAAVGEERPPCKVLSFSLVLMRNSKSELASSYSCLFVFL